MKSPQNLCGFSETFTIPLMPQSPLLSIATCILIRYEDMSLPLRNYS